MKALALIMTLALLTTNAMARTIVLKREHQSIGHLKSDKGGQQKITINIVRKSKTPSEVVLHFSYDAYKNVCIQRVMTNGQTETNVYGPFVVYKNTGPRAVCVESRSSFKTIKGTLTLDFSEASVLEEGQKEKFQIQIIRPNVKSNSLSRRAVRLESEADYVIYRDGATLRFVKTDEQIDQEDLEDEEEARIDSSGRSLPQEINIDGGVERSNTEKQARSV